MPRTYAVWMTRVTCLAEIGWCDKLNDRAFGGGTDATSLELMKEKRVKCRTWDKEDSDVI